MGSGCSRRGRIVGENARMSKRHGDRGGECAYEQAPWEKGGTAGEKASRRKMKDWRRGEGSRWWKRIEIGVVLSEQGLQCGGERDCDGGNNEGHRGRGGWKARMRCSNQEAKVRRLNGKRCWAAHGGNSAGGRTGEICQLGEAQAWTEMVRSGSGRRLGSDVKVGRGDQGGELGENVGGMHLVMFVNRCIQGE
ncbi:hypothetical protein CBR_g20368 [Chara braunii]|uniref:Uncharacterized protein n=1 Tax=Chara braunii TaxID=69332 RepID=A0A388JU95_CHABU|nr:hypothetical protein CBR_g20368 [Chara braunii]|eukprot:GBG61333.1 hypothetical protein CBR_g20368 [Chara braunii]